MCVLLHETGPPSPSLRDAAPETFHQRGAEWGGRLEAAYLENLFKIRPAGVTSKKDIGDRKMAVAILSCSFRDA